MEVDEHLFRREAGRLVGTLTHIFGVHNLAMAEDVVQDAFCRALEVWKFRGVPENPSAWLMTTAKNRALDILRRERTAQTFAPELSRLLQSEWTLAPTVQEIFEPNAIKDDQLRMMFSCCHPKLAEEAQVALVLNILCGFGVDEIAGAFVSGRAAIEKRISRAKKVLAGSKKLFDVTDPKDFPARLGAVQRALYLLFNEGYHGASSESVVRVELCQEAMRLTATLLEFPPAATPATHALSALMCLHAARLPSRVDEAGNLTLFFEQDRSQWDARLIGEGQRLLDLSATGSGDDGISRGSRDCRDPLLRGARGGNGLGKDRLALRQADGDPAFAGDSAQSRDSDCASMKVRRADWKKLRPSRTASGSRRILFMRRRLEN